ncbi:hypothetical protein AnaeK_3530 [Anaeromyxobacter sp. K]|uniref:Uncharacterized protein n=1 Tax=Anaeromyxobacter dehalogenans (strain ATCC BAA-258 / DSM 21875 / 2CP-1) TaxID=455488 RepID=B8J633_ANAD2|nr:MULTISPECIES: DUF1049 domain-containing protein [Anaeromyxobacter]ACG74743.1 hypothetical protein AnaeK_3530 [Anaeromyxobacter sp. K]ACL66928.1 conserved hypothetical protein [Anaeromyxobacter dehalogenans 2CP-1]
MSFRARTAIAALLLAAAIGFAAGWLVGLRSDDSMEARVRDEAHRLRERVHELSR